MKLTIEQVLEIRELTKEGVAPKAVADKVGCLASQVTYHTRNMEKVPGRSRRGLKPEPAPIITPPTIDITPVPPVEAPLDLENFDTLGANATNIRRLQELRDDSRASVGDQIRAADLLMKWQRGIEDDELQQKLSDEDYENLLVTMLEELDPAILARVASRVSVLSSA